MASDLHNLLSKRVSVLESINNGNVHRDEIQSDVGLAESTAYKAVRELTEEDLVQRENGVYEITQYGRCALRLHRKAVSLAERGDLFNLLGDEVEHELFFNAEVVRPEKHAPYRPVERIEDIILSSDNVCGLSPAVVRRFMEFMLKPLDKGIEAEFVLEKDVLDEILDGHRSLFEEAMDRGAEVMVTEDEFPYGLLFTDSTVILVAYDDEIMKGCLVEDNEDAYEWTKETYRKHKKNAERHGSSKSY